MLVMAAADRRIRVMPKFADGLAAELRRDCRIDGPALRMLISRNLGRRCDPRWISHRVISRADGYEPGMLKFAKRAPCHLQDLHGHEACSAFTVAVLTHVLSRRKTIVACDQARLPLCCGRVGTRMAQMRLSGRSSQIRLLRPWFRNDEGHLVC
jgi:hypothetical protein